MTSFIVLSFLFFYIFLNGVACFVFVMYNVTQGLNGSAFVIDNLKINDCVQTGAIDYSLIDQRLIIVSLTLLFIQVARYVLFKLINRNYNKNKIDLKQYQHKIELLEFFDNISFPLILFCLMVIFHLF